MSRNVVPCTQPAGQGNDFELIPTVQMESQHSVGVPVCRDFPRFVIISEKLRPEVGSSWRCSCKSWPFWKKTPYGQIFKNVFRKDSWRHRSTSCGQISWNLADRKSVKSCVIYRTKKNKISARSLALASTRMTPKICQGQLRTIYPECPTCHPTRFTSGGVIARRVNTVQTRHKVFPILGEAAASSPSNKLIIKK